MSEIVSKWIQHRLGLIIDMSPDNFAIKTANGYLLSQILHSYQIIVPEQLNLIVETDIIKQCYDNFKHINIWLKELNIKVPDEDLYEVVHGVGSASLHLFYRVFLELKEKTQLDFLTDNEINAQLGTKFTRFQVKKDDAIEDSNKIDLHYDGLCEPFLAGGDVYHWYKDRIESLQNRCKEAREDYAHVLKTRCRSCGIDHMPRIHESALFVLPRGISPGPSLAALNDLDRLPDEDVSYDERTYEELVNKQKVAREQPQIIPNPKEAKKIIKKLKLKSKTRCENNIMRNELHHEIMNQFDKKINENKLKSQDRVLTKIFLRQSCFEKELISKLGQVKMQKEFMIENKSRQTEVLNKLKEKEFINTIILQDKEMDEKKLMFYLERERILLLHKKIWEQRLRLRAKRHEILCSNALKDIVDISIKISEYRVRFGQEPTRRDLNDLKNIFVSAQPVFDICEPVVNIMKERDEFNDIAEDIITMETLRQDVLDQQEFDSYIKYEWPWELKNIDSPPEMIEQISYGLNVLGRIVHQVLSAKYPLPPTREKPDFPDARVRVCINGLNDPTCLPILSNLLSDREIEIIELTQAVDFCVHAYHIESKREHDDDEDAVRKEAKKKKGKADKGAKKGQKSKQKGKTKSEAELATMEEPKVFENKMVQTPIIYPCEKVALSPQASWGQIAQEFLDNGQPLSDEVLIAMFVEYLKSKPKLKGWVLINYPTNYEQAAILEEVLAGTKILNCKTLSPDGKHILEIADIEDHPDNLVCAFEEVLIIKRKSRLLSDPVHPETVQVYDTILTAYIKLKKIPTEEENGDTIFPPVFEELGNEPDLLDKFYSDAGANYSLYYKDFDLTTLKYLGKLIIGDYSLPLKSSVELFGEHAMHQMELASSSAKSLKAAKKGQQKKRPKEKSPTATAVEGSDKNTSKKSIGNEKKGKGKAKVIIVHEDKYTQIPTDEEDEIEEMLAMTEIIIPTPTAGQQDWQYSVVTCPEELMIALATLWETIEEIYINDLKQLFFLKRLNMNSVMPYVQYVKDIMKKNIDRPDFKGFYLAKFQKAFNVFDMDFRKDDEFKAEMYCRIEDFKENLAEMCDGKMMKTESARCNIIRANWATNQITQLFNNYINMFQIEMDRFMETLRFVDDYFTGVFTGKPCEDDSWKDDAFPKISQIDSDILNVMLENIDSDVDLSFFEVLLSTIIQKAAAGIKKLNTISSNNMEKVKSGQIPSTPKSKVSSPKLNKSKDDRKSTAAEVDIVKENYSKLIEEWHCIVKGESIRVTLRLELLKYNALEILREFIEALRSCFHSIYEDIRSSYWQEIENIENACKIFHAAVEHEKQVQKELIFVDHTFYINPEINLFENAPIIPELPKEIVEEGAFTVEQLSKVTDILLDLCPSGYIIRASFIFFIQDIIWNNPEDGLESLAPMLWKKLEPSGVRKLIDELFDDLEYVYWRDFIVYNLRINFPTDRELLLTRQNIRECDPDGTELVQDYQFSGTKLWFEYSYKTEDANKIKEAKKLLLKLYYVKDCGVNYTALLLDFCKDDAVLQGFSKALELSLGKLVCWNSDVGNSFERAFLKKIREHEENVKLRDDERAEYYKATYEELCGLVDYVVHISEEVTIEDYTEDQRISHKSEYATKKSLTKRDESENNRRSNVRKSIDGSRNDRRGSKLDEIKFKRIGTVENVIKENSHNSEADENILEQDGNKETSEEKVMRQIETLPNNVYTDATENTNMAFFLPLDVVITVITAALPWHSRVQMYDDLSFWEQAAQIHESKRNSNFNNAVLAHAFLNSDEFLNLLGMTKKFKALDPVRIVKNILDAHK